MDYSIGSLSDLITGKNTPNKLKVITKPVSLKDSKNAKNENEESVTVSASLIKKKLKKSKPIDVKTGINQVSKKQKLKKSRRANPVETGTDQVNRKRKLLDPDENEPTSKRSKNSENAKKRLASKEKNRVQEDPETLSRTIFVGNVPITSDTKKIKKLFRKYGKIESVRIRGFPVANPKTPKKIAIIKKEFHPERKSFFAYVRFEERDDAIKALEANGSVYKDHHLRVHLCVGQETPDESKAIFVGNLSFYAEEEDLWKIFEPCGSIASVRIIRDEQTGIGKGFGYVNFYSSDSVTLALEMEDIKLKDRELRISICNTHAAKKNKKKNKVKQITKPGKPRSLKKDKNKDKTVNNNKKEESKSTPFQGIKFSEKKKKHKLNKGLLQKKKMIKLVAPK